MTDYRETLRRIRTFPSLIKFLQDELDWPIISGDFEELTFDYTPEELGIDTANAAKIQEIKRLRPLEVNQPWGIFFVMFEPKRLPVVALRRILSRVVLKKRASANRAESAAWQADDLLFVSNFGEGDERQISFAHFAQHGQKNDLPTLKVLGWDNLDTPLHLDYVADELVGKLFWPDDPGDLEKWRKTWRSAFTLRHGEVINTSKDLAVRLAELARAIRDRIKTVLAIETANGPLTKLMKAFQEALVHDLDADGFADMYAQTIAYGLLSARVENPQGKTADDLAAQMTNPFLKELMETFLHVGGRKGKASNGNGIDFDELGVSEVVELLDTANMEAVVRDFGDLKPEEDPVIHFYELFLKEYDAKKKMQRGVFYTPRPVVSYIVRSVDEFLRTEFGLADGLADTTTWGEMAERQPSLNIPPAIKPDEAFVQILDPATGTGTFLVEVIDVIHKTLRKKWEAAGNSATEIDRFWNDYVPRHLLPRLYGYELLMAPYAIAHMKIGLKLYETGYRFGSDERVRVYLTNALEPAHNFSGKLAFMIPALAHEAQAVNAIKRHQRFTIVIGNPPYSNLSANLTPTARALVEKYKFIDGERVVERNALQLERNLNDDYVKFMAWSEDRLGETGLGILSMISNNVYTWSPTLRGMRAHLLKTFSYIRILDLHGASQRGPADSRFQDDKNVFDIEQPVAVGTFFLLVTNKPSSIGYSEVVGPRTSKYTFLLGQSSSQLQFEDVVPTAPAWRFTSSKSENEDEYSSFPPLSAICPLFAEGIKTGRDWLVVDFESAPILERMRQIRESKESDDALCERIVLSRKKAWNLTKARAELRNADLAAHIYKLAYRPFDERAVFYHPNWIASSSFPVMRNLTKENQATRRQKIPKNIAILAGRISRDQASRLYWCSSQLTDKCILSSLDNVSAFPALVFSGSASGSLDFGEAKPEPNLSREFIDAFSKQTGLQKPTQNTDELLQWTFEIFHYFYAILWSPAYRDRYSQLISADFPRLPLTSNLELFRTLARLGGELVALQLVEAPVQQAVSARYDQSARAWRYDVVPGHHLPLVLIFTGPAAPVVEKMGWSDDTVWLDAVATKKGQPAMPGSIGFHGVPEEVWNFHIGGYQVCQKWLKDRKARTLSADDLTHYHRIVIALHETIRLMGEIDQVIDQHGGWPGAFTDDAQDRS